MMEDKQQDWDNLKAVISEADKYQDRSAVLDRALANPNSPQAYEILHAKSNREANSLCVLSLILMYVPDIVWRLILGVIARNNLGAWIDGLSNHSGMYTLGWAIGFGFSIAAFVLMIFVRVKYPKNSFGKVLMVIYIAQIIMGLIALFLLIMACGNALDSFSISECIRSVGEIG